MPGTRAAAVVIPSLARRRINVLYAMLRDGAFHTSRTITV